jgi:hypothetical protein
MAKGCADCEITRSACNALLDCLPVNFRVHWGCATVRKEAKDVDSPPNQFVLPIFVAVFVFVVVCIVIPFSGGGQILCPLAFILYF